jgi:pimeloyl-ACP methyl ester carboxylesterase
MEMVAQQPAMVASLGLIHSHVFADTEEKKDHRTAAMDRIKTSGREELVSKMIPSFFDSSPAEKRIAQKLVDRGMTYDDHAWYFGMEAMRDRIDHRKTLQSLTVPVLMIMGEKDTAVPIEMAYQQAALCERNKLCVYCNSRHMAMYDNTAQMIGDLLSFYDDL